MTDQGARLGVDIGGTFTDVVLETATGRHSTKVLTTYEAPETAIVAGMHQVCAKAGLTPAAIRAEETGVQLVLENIEDMDPGGRVELAERLGRGVKLSLDTGHAFYAHRATGGPPVDAHVHAAGANLAHVHLQDADGYADRHWAIGEGSINWRPLMELISAKAPDARMILELRGHEGIPASFE